MDLLDFTYFIFILVVIILILFPATYLSMNGQTINLIQQRSVWKDLRILIPCILYAVILGFRYNYAFDWEQYRYTFEFLKNGHLYRETTEKGYLALNYLLIQLGFNYYSIFVFEGFLWIFSIAYILKDNRKALILGWAITFLLMRFDILNLSRQFLAISILLIAFALLLEGKDKKFWIFSIIAGSIHSTAIVCIIPFFLLSKLAVPKKNISIYIYVLIYLLFIFIAEFLMSYLFDVMGYLGENVFQDKAAYTVDFLQEDRFSRKEHFTLVRYLIAAVKDFTYISFFLWLCKRNVLNRKMYVILLIGLLSIYFQIVFVGNELTARFNYYFRTFYGIGWGIIFAYFLSYFRYIPIYLKWGLFIVILHIFYVSFSSISYEFTEFKTFLMYDLYL